MMVTSNQSSDDRMLHFQEPRVSRWVWQPQRSIFAELKTLTTV